MNGTKLFAAAAIFGVSSAAFAQGSGEYDEFDNVGHAKTRAEVKAELARAQASGDLARSGEFVDAVPMSSTLSRAQVRAELARAYYAGDMRRNTEWVEHTHVASTKTREEVRNEVLRAGKTRSPGSGS